MLFPVLKNAFWKIKKSKLFFFCKICLDLRLLFQAMALADLSSNRKKGIKKTISRIGVIGSRARLRIWCRKAWGFESLHPDHNGPSIP